MNKLVSVCIPTYNRENIIAHTIESVINQTYKNIEIIISDNCSTDNTYNIIQEYAKNDSRITIFKMSENKGPVENWKNCFFNASGEFVKFLWSDDYISTDYIEKSLNVFDDDVGFVYTPVKWYDVKTLNINHRNVGYRIGSSSKYSLEYFVNQLIYNGSVPVSGSCALFRKNILNELFNKEINNSFGLDFNQNGAGFDALMFLYAYKKYEKFYFLDDNLSFFGVDSDGITVSQGEKLRPYYFSTFLDYLNECKSKDLNLLSILKTRILFYKIFLTKDVRIKNKLNKIFSSIEQEINSKLITKLIVEHYKNFIFLLVKKLCKR